MSDEHTALTAEAIARKLLARQKLTIEERAFLDSSDTIMAAVIQEVYAAHGPKNGHPGTPPNGYALGKSEREAAERALAHGKAVLAREFPGIFEGSV